MTSQLDAVVADLMDEDSRTPAGFEKYGQVIDRMMGTANTLGLNNIRVLCEKGKVLGYKLSQVENPGLLVVASPVLMDLLVGLKDHMDHLSKNGREPERNTGIISRLE